MSQSGTQLFAECATQFTRGWNETIEYHVIIGGVAESRAKRMHYDPLLDQLQLAARMPASMGSDGGCNPNKSGSKPPLNIAPLNLIDDITSEAWTQVDIFWELDADLARYRKAAMLDEIFTQLTSLCHKFEDTHPDHVYTTAKCGQAWVKRARILLGYEARETTLADMVCGSCSGALVVAVDASTDVRCVGSPAAPSCGASYPRLQWIDLL